MSTELAVRETNSITTIATWNELEKRAEYFAKSQLIPQALRGKPFDVAIILQMGMEVGLSPLQALNSINVIQGKPAMGAEGQLALIYSKVPGAYIKIDQDHAKQKVTVRMARSKDEKDEAYVAEWDMDRARKQKLTGKDNYATQPMTMLKWRAVGEAARSVFPDVMKGMKNDAELLAEGEDDGNDGDGPKNETAEQKVARLAALNQNKSETKDVVSEVAEHGAQSGPISSAPIEPEVLPPEPPAQPQADPLADYVIPIGDHAGKRLRDFQPGTLAEYFHRVKAHYSQQKTEPKGKWLEFLTRIEQYLGSNIEEDSGPMFGDA